MMAQKTGSTDVTVTPPSSPIAPLGASEADNALKFDSGNIDAGNIDTGYRRILDHWLFLDRGDTSQESAHADHACFLSID